MNIAFFVGEMNFRGVANSTYLYSHYNERILKNKSYIFYDETNTRNNLEVLNKFKKRFDVRGVKSLQEIETFKAKLKLKYLYIQKGGKKDQWHLHNLKTFIHSVYPQKIKEVHGHKYVFISEWMTSKISNNKIPFVPYIVELKKVNNSLKTKLKISKNQIVFGCHGGNSSFDLNFVQDTIKDIVKKKKNYVFLFFNIKKFCNHPRVIFLKGSSNEIFKRKFLNTCDAMIYGRSLGESFGLACAEFAYLNKLIISYKFNRHRAHLYHLNQKDFIEYSSRRSLFEILDNFKLMRLGRKQTNKYHNFNPKYVMRLFKKVFLQKETSERFSIIDYIINYVAFIKMNYFYLRHKIYNHYYRYIESKFNN